MDVEIKFEPEGRSGIVPTGTYLLDAAKRLGVRLGEECDRQGNDDSCKVKIIEGRNLLSEPTKAETDFLSAEQLIAGERLSCQTKIVGQGELTVMVEKKKEPEKTAEEKKRETEEKTAEDFRKQFEKMPLDEKMAALVDLEAVALGETFNYVLNSPYAVVGKVMDVLAGFGRKMETEDVRRKRPVDQTDESKSADAVEDDAAKDSTAKKGAAKAKKAGGKNEDNAPTDEEKQTES